MTRTRGAVIRMVLLVVSLGLVALVWRRRRGGAAPRGEDGGGGLAGDREPRNPVPPTLVDAGVGIPEG